MVLKNSQQSKTVSSLFHLTDGEWLNGFLLEVRSVVIFIHNFYQNPVVTLKKQQQF